MYSKEEAKKLRQEFWISFGKSFPRKWTLYNTKIKDFSFRFNFDKRAASVSIQIEQASDAERARYFTRLLALRPILLELIPDLVFDDSYILPNGKKISCVCITLYNVSIHNKDTWQTTMLFLKDHMEHLESFWEEYQDFIRA